MTSVTANRLEMMQIADAVAREKLIDREVVIEAMEEAMQKAARSRYGSEIDLRVRIDRKNGAVTLKKVVTVVDEVEDPEKEMSLAQAHKLDPSKKVGDTFEEELPPIDFGRVATMTAKQVITQKVREAERNRQYQEYKDRVGEIVNGIVKRIEYGHIIIDLGRGEGVIRREQAIPRENVVVGDRIRAYLFEVKNPEEENHRGPLVFLSRAHPDFMRELFKMEVPEVYEGTIEIVAVARDPGSRAKIGVRSKDPGIDPVGACVGMRGSRVQAVVNELAGEKIDIIPYTEDAAQFVIRALQPAEVTKVVLDEDEQRVEVVVSEPNLPLAIGRRGQNVRLAHQLTGWQIDIMTEEEESKRRQKEFKERTELFMAALDVDEMLAQLLTVDGFTTVEEVAYVDPNELVAIEGFDEDTAQELQARAREHLEKVAAELDQKRKELGVEDALAELEELTPEMVVTLGENEIKTLEDLAGLIPDDLRGWYETKEIVKPGPHGVRRDRERIRHTGILDPYKVDSEQAEHIIMRARVAAGWIDEADLAPPASDEELEGGEDAAFDDLGDLDLDAIDLEDLEEGMAEAAAEAGDGDDAEDDEGR